MFTIGILQKQQYIHGLKHDVTIAGYSLVPTTLHEFHNSKGHQGTICTFGAIQRPYWSPKLWIDIVGYIAKFSICVKHMPNMATYPQHLEIPQLPMAVITTDTIGHLPITSKCNRWALTAIILYTSYMLTILMKEKSAENVGQVYLSGILAHKGRSVAILSDNGTEFKNKVLNDECDQLGIKRLFSNPFHPQGIEKSCKCA